MANILSTSQIVQKLLDFLKTSQPNLDTKPGTVSRDLFVDGPSIRLAELYNELSRISSLQSISKSVGDDLDNLASNYSVQRLQPGKSTGAALLTFNSLLSDITIPTGSLVYSKNGLAFRIISGVVISSANESQYRALATTFRSDLDFVGITDNYAVQVMVECTTAGTAGNISKYSLSAVSIPGISNLTNTAPFAGGSSTENDTSYKNRILAVFSGSNTGTSLGYRNIVIANPSVVDAIVVGPGDPLMTRDDTIQATDENGNLILDSNGDPTILSEGTGGKVDIYVYGRRIVENLDSFIYNDKSGKNDPTDSSNDYIIGQIADDENKTITKKRKDNLESGTLPNQPVQSIIEVLGSLSGTFTPQVIDQYGNSIGNFTLLKDTGTYAESIWGADKLQWVRNYVITSEDITKNVFNGQDTLLYSDSFSIDDVRRTILVINENSTISSTDRSKLYLNHTPIRAINKVLNYTTGERYVVTNRNPGGNSGDLNTSGEIIISGKNLPSVSDILQVDYEWEYVHDIYTDLYSFVTNDNPRTAIDVVDWGYGNAITREPAILSDGYTITTQHNISSVISVNKVAKDYNKAVSVDSSGNLVIIGLSAVIANVVSVKRVSDGAELYNTRKKDGSFDGSRIVLPSDTSATSGDLANIVFNAMDLYTLNGTSGTFKDNVIYLTNDAKSIVTLMDILEINYVANINEILPSTNLSALPAVKYYNNFRTNGSSISIGTQPVTNIYSGTYVNNNLRKTPSKLGINVSGISANGVISVRGKTSEILKDVVFTCTNNGLKLDFSVAIKQFLGIDLSLSLPTNIKISKVVSIEKVETTSGVVTDSLYSFDITGYSLYDNSFVLEESVLNTSLKVTETQLPYTVNNLANQLYVGDQLRATFYIVYTNDVEAISFSTNGTLYSDKSFAYIDSISVSSGFKSGTTLVGALSMFALSQPPSGSRYRSKYKYTAPKNGERITLRYNTNILIGDLTFEIEEKRPITADVIVKSASSILIDVSADILVLREFEESKTIVAQNVGDKIASYINSLSLGATLHPSDIVNVAYQVTGLDSIVIQRFNKSNVIGNASYIKAFRNQYMQANNIQITTK